MKMIKGGPLGAVGTVRSFMSVVKDIDFEDVRARAERAPLVLVIAPEKALADEATNTLFGSGSPSGVTAEEWGDRSSLESSRYDAIIVYDPNGSGLFDRVRKTAGAGHPSANIFFLAKEIGGGGNPAEQIRGEVMDAIPDLAPAFGRAHESWRPAAVKAIVDQSSRANAQFALMSNVTAVVPVLGNLAAAGADLLVLTKNQVMMCYKIAAAHDRNLSNHFAVVRELTPVVGVGFLWRTAAREAATMVPFAAGTIPKVAIAFAGTMTMGKAADYYYRYGSKPDKGQIGQFVDQAQKVMDRIPGLNGTNPLQQMGKQESPAPSSSDAKSDSVAIGAGESEKASDVTKS